MTDIPATARPAGGPETGGGQGPGTPRGKKGRRGTTGNRWQSWWRTNRQPYVTLRGDRALVDETGALGFLNGGGRREADSNPSALSDADVRHKVLPALREALRSDEGLLMHDAALAIGRLLEPGDAEGLDQLRQVLKSRHAEARHAAILALGLTRERSTMSTLWGIMHDSTEACEALGSKGGLLDYERASATLAFGMVCPPAMQSRFCRFVEKQARTDHELGATAVMALGLVRDPQLNTIRCLGRLLQDESLHRSVRAQVPVALARLGEDAVPLVPSLLENLTASKRSSEIRQSCAIALGRLASVEDQEVVRAFTRIVQKEQDAPLRQFAYMGLAEIGARGLRARGACEGAERIAAFLSSQLADLRHAADLPWAVLAAGKLGREVAAESPERNRLVDDLSDLLKRHRNPDEQGALALALGLLEARETGPELLKLLEDSNDTTLQGHLAVALGLMNYREARSHLRDLLDDRRDPNLRIEVATGLGLMGDAGASQILVESMRKSEDSVTTTSLAWSLATLRQPAALDLVLELAGPERGSVERRNACTALGVLAERSLLPWHAELAMNSNYLLPLPLQNEILGLF